MTPIQAPPFSQAAVEQVTGLSREVLRKWELRYQFPTPLRGARGQRLYSPEDVQRLLLIQHLAARGLRAGKLVPLSLAQLTALQDDASARPAGLVRESTQIEVAVQALLACLAPGAAPHAVSAQLEQGVREVGLAYFVDQYLPAFNLAVGEAWSSGRLGVHAEHHYTESVRNVVLRILSRLHPTQAQPRVLLTTPPGELHGLGLLALQAALTLLGADCVSLGTQTPVADVVQAAHDLDTALVALSVSMSFEPTQMRSYVKALRQQLPVSCRLWVGGKGCEPLLGHALAGVTVFQSTGQAIEAWKQLVHETT